MLVSRNVETSFLYLFHNQHRLGLVALQQFCVPLLEDEFHKLESRCTEGAIGVFSGKDTFLTGNSYRTVLQ